MKAVCRYVLDEMPGSRPKQVLLVGYVGLPSVVPKTRETKFS